MGCDHESSSVARWPGLPCVAEIFSKAERTSELDTHRLAHVDLPT